MKRVVTQMTYGRHTVCKATTRILTKHRRRLTAVLVAFLLGLVIGSYVSYQVPVRDNVNVHAPNNVSVLPFSNTSSLGAGSERDYLLHRPDGHGNTVRVMIMLTGTRVMDIHCYAVASAYFADLPVVIAGYEERYTNNRKIGLALDVARLAGMSESDVVMVLDADVMFSGQDMLPYIDKFIAQSAASPDDLDAKAVREGRAMAPSVYSAETNCYAPQRYRCSTPKCSRDHYRVELDVAAYAHRYNGTFSPLLQKAGDLSRYINSGTSIHRLWSLRALNASYTSFITSNKPNCRGDMWYCDQSVIISLYLEVRRWELQSDFLARTALNGADKSPSGLRAGQLQVDLMNELSAVLLPTEYAMDYMLSTELWNSSDVQTYHKVFGDGAVQFVRQQYIKAHKDLQLTQRTLTLRHGRSMNISLTPSMLLVRRHIMNAPSHEMTVFPLMSHFANAPKDYRMSAYLTYSPWYLPMMFDKAQWVQGRDYLLSMPMELWNATTRARVRYADVCPQHPFSMPPIWD